MLSIAEPVGKIEKSKDLAVPPLSHRSQDGIITYVVCFMTWCMRYNILIYIYIHTTHTLYIYIEIVGKYMYIYIHIITYIYIYYLNSGQIFTYTYTYTYIYIYVRVSLWSYVVSKYIYIYICTTTPKQNMENTALSRLAEDFQSDRCRGTQFATWKWGILYTQKK